VSRHLLTRDRPGRVIGEPPIHRSGHARKRLWTVDGSLYDGVVVFSGESWLERPRVRLTILHLHWFPAERQWKYNADSEEPMFTATADLILPSTVTGSSPRPRWFDVSMLRRPLDICMLDVRFREKFQDALAVVIDDQEARWVRHSHAWRLSPR
jgi:hypothetical protein